MTVYVFEGKQNRTEQECVLWGVGGRKAHRFCQVQRRAPQMQKQGPGVLALPCYSMGPYGFFWAAVHLNTPVLNKWERFLLAHSTSNTQISSTGSWCSQHFHGIPVTIIWMERHVAGRRDRPSLDGRPFMPPRLPQLPTGHLHGHMTSYLKFSGWRHPSCSCCRRSGIQAGLAGTAWLCSTRWWLEGSPRAGGSLPPLSGTPPFSFMGPSHPCGLCPLGRRCPLQEVLAACGYLHRKQYWSKLFKTKDSISQVPVPWQVPSSHVWLVATAPASVGPCLGLSPQQDSLASSPGTDTPLTHSRALGPRDLASGTPDATSAFYWSQPFTKQQTQGVENRL